MLMWTASLLYVQLFCPDVTQPSLMEPLITLLIVLQESGQARRTLVQGDTYV